MIPVAAPAGVKRSLYLGASPTRRPSAAIRLLADWLPKDTPPFGAGNTVTVLEERAAGLFGKDDAVFLPTGKMAQQIALRINADQTGVTAFAAHPTSHVVNYELDGYARVHGLTYLPLGDADRLITLDDITGLDQAVSTVLWELPQREIGGVMPEWSSLLQQIDTVKARGARTHLDGARVWEAQTYYGTAFDEIAGPFDSVYVSLYKALEAPRGALLMGEKDFIAEARRWSVRLGGESNGNWPLAAAGLYALDEVLPKLKQWKAYAVDLAAAIAAAGATPVPSPPHTPFFFVEVPASAKGTAAAHEELCAETGLELFRFLRETADPLRCSFEISVSEAATQISTNDVGAFVAELIARASEYDRRCRDEEKSP